VHPNTEIVLRAAAARGLAVEAVTHPDGTRTAEDAARAIGCDVAQIVKSLVFDLVDTEGAVTPVIALVSGANRLDEAKLAAAAGAARAARVDAERVRAVTGFPIGGVAPLGHPTPVRTFVDPDLLAHSVVWAAAGTPRAVFALSPDQLVAATSGTVVDLAAG
jgi:Cys-tRNA(Pro) deacylase